MAQTFCFSLGGVWKVLKWSGTYSDTFSLSHSRVGSLHIPCETCTVYRSWQDASFLQWQECVLKSVQVAACSLVELSYLTAFLFCCQFVLLHFQESVQPALLGQLCLSSYISLSTVLAVSFFLHISFNSFSCVFLLTYLFQQFQLCLSSYVSVSTVSSGMNMLWRAMCAIQNSISCSPWSIFSWLWSKQTFDHLCPLHPLRVTFRYKFCFDYIFFFISLELHFSSFPFVFLYLSFPHTHILIKASKCLCSHVTDVICLLHLSSTFSLVNL